LVARRGNEGATISISTTGTGTSISVSTYAV
jgi:hypothetical protein